MIARNLRDVSHYQTLFPGLTLSQTTATIIATTRHLLQGIYTDFKALGKAVVKLEREIRKHNLYLPKATLIQGEVVYTVVWKWDNDRQDHYYWHPKGYYEYSKGIRLKRDGTLYAEEVEVKEDEAK